MSSRYLRKHVYLCFVLAILFSAGCTDATSQWKFIVTGDSRGTCHGDCEKNRPESNNGVNTTILSEIAAEIIKQDAEFVLFPGDLIDGDQGGTQKELRSQFITWRQTMQPVYDAGIGVYLVRGNHDVGWEPIQSPESWNKIFSGDYAMPDNGPAEPLNLPYSNAKNHVNLTYSFEHENALIVGLDNYLPHNLVPQKWLDEQLEANTKPHVFIFGHEPAFQVISKEMLTGGSRARTNVAGQYVAERDTFWQSIKKAGGRIYFCGHDHSYNHARIDEGDGNLDNDIHQLIVATAGAELYPWDGKYDGYNSTYNVICEYHELQYGYVLVEVDGLEVTLTWMARAGAGKYISKEVWSYTSVVVQP